MSLENQLLFLFSAFGAINGLFLSFYFAFYPKKKQIANYFLSALLFVLSIRIIKSVFFYFNRDLSEVFIQIGLSACVLIGPFLYLYCKAMLSDHKNRFWWLHIVPVLVLVTVLGWFFPYWTFKSLWSKYIVKTIYFIWLLYILNSASVLKSIFLKIFDKSKPIKQIEIWLISVWSGVTLIWFGYIIGAYTSYIVGSLSFSFVFYLLVLFWFFRRNKETLFFEEPIKYNAKKIEDKEAFDLKKNLDNLINKKELYKNPNLKLKDLAKEIKVSPHYLSQFLNDNLNKSFSLFINEYRIQEAKELLIDQKHLTTEAIGYECGFNSKSTFFTTFKKITGKTPSNFRTNSLI